jgi:hypothetical protein
LSQILHPSMAPLFASRLPRGFLQKLIVIIENNIGETVISIDNNQFVGLLITP